jgi:gluconolactonase
MNIFARDLGFPEAPVALPDGSFLFVEMSEDKGWIIRITADGKDRRVIAKTGRPNGLACDRNGSVWVAETAQRALLKMNLNGQYETFAQSAADEPFLFLNDLAFAPNGELFVTDSGILHDDIVPGGQLVPNYRDLKFDGRVYRIDVATKHVEIIDRGFKFTNGLAFGPDGALYVAETLTGNIYRYASRGGRIKGERELFGNVIENFNPAELKGPDGMKFGADGNLYVCVFGQGDVTVLGRNGTVIERIETAGVMPTNLVFKDRRIYVTEVTTGTVQVIDVGTEGLRLND